MSLTKRYVEEVLDVTGDRTNDPEHELRLSIDR